MKKLAIGVALLGAAVWTGGAQAAVTPVRSLEGFYNADPEYVEQTGNLRFKDGFGVRTADMDDERTYMVDGCHIGSHRPVVLRNYWNLMNETGDWTALADFRRILSMHWRTLTYPEGMLVETENYDVRVTNDNPGAKQIFGAKAWLWDVIELNLGFRALKDGFTLHAMGDGVPFELRGFTLRGKTIDFRITGRGATASYVLNGKPLAKPFVAYDDLRDRNTVDVFCK